MFQIAQHGVSADMSRLAEMRAEFDERQCVLVQNALAPALLDRVLPLLADAPAHVRTPGRSQGRIVARELCVEPGARVSQALMLIFNNAELFRLIQAITECPPIGNFLGRIYMMQPDAGHYDTWHTDNDGNRMIGLSCNLSSGVYSGGVFQIREQASTRLIGEIANVGLGDVHIFKIGSGFEHRVTPVTGSVTKAAYAGWFRAQPASREMYGL